MKKLPFITISLACLAALPLAAPTQFQYDREAIPRGEVWRLLSCQWTHWSLNHLAWDLTVFLAFGILCEQQSRRTFVGAIAASTLLVPLAIHFACRDILTFRGLSGIDSAFAGLLLSTLFVAARNARAAVWQLAALAGAIVFIAKCACEHATGQTLFASSNGRWRVVPLSHAVGFASGVIANAPALFIRRLPKRCLWSVASSPASRPAARPAARSPVMSAGCS